MTDGRGPDCCIDCVGAEAHGAEGFDPDINKAQPNALAQIFKSCKKGGNVSIPGVYVGKVDGLPMGVAMNKSFKPKNGANPYATLSRAFTAESCRRCY